MAVDATHDLGRPRALQETYYPDEFKGKLYLAGDGASTDEEGYFRIVGRIDDVLNVSGHRLGDGNRIGAGIEHKLVAEAAVVGRPDDLTGRRCARLSCSRVRDRTGRCKQNRQGAARLGSEGNWPDCQAQDIRFGDNLPKTRSGKIMRRLLRSIAKGEEITQDVSTLENPAILEQLKVTL